MIQTVTRPFTDQEREEVERQLLEFVSEPVRFGVPCSLWGDFAGLIGGIIFTMTALLIIGASDRRLMGILVVCAGVGFALAWHDYRQTESNLRDSRRQYAAQLAKRLLRGEIEDMSVTASGVVRVVDNYDGINAYFFDVGDNSVLHIREEPLWRAAGDSGPDADAFLPSAFRLTRYPDADDEIVYWKSSGPLLAPLCTISVSGLEEEYYELANLDVLENVSLTTLETDLPFLFLAESVQ